jgi:putative SOS response-associated peptidase YedK
MCGRYTLSAPTPFDVRARFPVGESIEIAQRFNVAPGDDVLAVTTTREGEPRGELLRWGLVPSWAESPQTGLKMINARVETVAEKPAYRRAFERFRCLIVADGFYEFTDPVEKGKKRKDKWLFTKRGDSIFCIAGIWRETKEVGEAFTMLTMEPGPDMAGYHDRQIILLEKDAWLDWLAPSIPAKSLIKPLPAGTLSVQRAG